MPLVRVGLVLAVAGAALTGCVGMPSPFDGERSRADELPAFVPPVEGGVASSARYQGQSGGYDVYLLKGEPPYQVCIVATAGTAETTLSSCGGGAWLQTSVADGTAFRVQLQGFDGDPDPTGIEISPWVHDVTGVPDH